VIRSDHTDGWVQGRQDFARGIERDVTGYSEAYQGGYAEGLRAGSFYAHEREVEVDRERRREAGLD
jgi:hypothetical protein